jgi:hypothetical protein
MELDLAISGRRQPMCSTRVLDLRSGRHARRRRFVNAALIVVSLAAVALVAQEVTLPPAADGRPHRVALGRATGACWLVKVTSGITGDHRILAKSRAILRRAGLPAEIWPATRVRHGHRGKLVVLPFPTKAAAARGRVRAVRLGFRRATIDEPLRSVCRQKG